MATVATMSSSNNNTPSDQIRQMVNFILQEAHEKANEIRVKVRLCPYMLLEFMLIGILNELTLILLLYLE